MNILSLITTGLSSLPYEDSTKNTALLNIEKWLTAETLREYVPYIEHLTAKADFATLLDSFWRTIPFGTGGRRGSVGAGPNRINPHTITLSVQGHCDQLRQTAGAENKPKVVLAYDVRQFHDTKEVYRGVHGVLEGLTSRELARQAAMTYAANGVVCYVVGPLEDEVDVPMCIDRYISTPELSFLIRALKASGGLNISASHNHPDDNGAKVYNAEGGQEPPPDDEALLEMVEKVETVKSMLYPEAREKGLIRLTSPALHDRYLQINIGCCQTNSRSAKVAYTPLCGTGINTVQEAFEKAGFTVSMVSEQSSFDGSFATVHYRLPNPEIPESMDKLTEVAESSACDIGMATDPDADRLGLVIPDDDGKFSPVLGNDIGVLLIESLCSFSKLSGGASTAPIFITTQVTTSLQSKIARRYGCQVIGDLMTGFKYMAEVLSSLERFGRFPQADGPGDKDSVVGTIDDFLFTCEESHGYLLSPEIRDKDACGAALHLAGLASYLKDRNRTIYGMLRDIYRVYGYHANQTRFLIMEGIVGIHRMNQILDRLRENPPTAIGGVKVLRMLDHQEIGGPIKSRTDAAGRNVLVFFLENNRCSDPTRVAVRPSGTEPKIKIYVEVPSTAGFTKSLSEVTEEELQEVADEELDRIMKETDAIARCIGDDFVTYCLGEDTLGDIYKSFPSEMLLVSDMVPVDAKIDIFTKFLPGLLKKLSENVPSGQLQHWIDEQLGALGENPGALLQNSVLVWFEGQLSDPSADTDLLLRAKELLDL
ncbi:MAG: phospho-sugar mutase [Proteobacteria bacterium]|nr:phospho-sugar mutase [Pseudomonadota bacterium]